MSSEQREMTTEEKIKDLYRLVDRLNGAVDEVFNTIDNLYGVLRAKADEYHGHSDIEGRIRDAEYHDHREYANDRHTHDRFDIR